MANLIPGTDIHAAENAPEGAYDVWLRFNDDYDEDIAEYEANVFADGDLFDVQWYHQDVGQVSHKSFTTYAEASAWLASEGFSDFSA